MFLQWIVRQEVVLQLISHSCLCLPFSEKWIWTVLHQLCERETAADFHWAHPEGRAGDLSPLSLSLSLFSLLKYFQSHRWSNILVTFSGGIRARRHQVDSDRIFQQQDRLWSHREQSRWIVINKENQWETTHGATSKHRPTSWIYDCQYQGNPLPERTLTLTHFTGFVN